MNVWGFLPEFVKALEEHLREDDKRWGDTWLKRTRKGQDERLIASTLDRFDKYQNGGQPLDYLAIIGDCLICWIREQHPELWKK